MQADDVLPQRMIRGARSYHYQLKGRKKKIKIRLLGFCAGAKVEIGFGISWVELFLYFYAPI